MLRLLLYAFAVCSICACKQDKRDTLFQVKGQQETGIDFRNNIAINDTFNALSFEYIYNGGGVGVGDFNQDGLEDLFFAGNQVSSELYLNKGNLTFEKVTAQAGLTTDRWITGVSVVDINADGLPDLYLSVGGKTSPELRKNLLFVHQGMKNGLPHFIEQAHSYGLDNDRYSTMSAFLDYDKDGDLDMYLVNNWLETFNRNNLRQRRMNGEAESTDCLYRNNGDNTFTDVSKEAGITIEGYGLGINVSDLNGDSWPDIYVSNDFLSSDLVWINQRDGTFKDLAGEYLKHQSHNGMGNDVADFNNDSKHDIVVVDMLPKGHKRQKLMTPGQNYDHFHMSLQMGYEPQYMRNTLQLNRGISENGTVHFSEIAFQSGIAQTDWSWAPLFADFDNDGLKDLFIANGYRKDVTNLDFVFFGLLNESPFGTKEARKRIVKEEFDKIDDVKLPNNVFRNTGTLRFEDKTKEWGTELPTFSNGAAYADFDNDGDLDLITNNIDQEVILYENGLNPKSNASHYLKVAFAGNELNQKVFVYTKGRCQFSEASPYRGFQSTVTKLIHFGLGENTRIDSISVVWSDNSSETLYSVAADTLLTFQKSNARKKSIEKSLQHPLHFTAVSPAKYKHTENSPSDIKITRTLLHELTRMGPCLAKGDVNGDGLDDFFVGGEEGTASSIFIQEKNGSFISRPLTHNTDREDGSAIFFDADNDRDLDLYTGSACSSSTKNASDHILYLNDGKGGFTKSSNLPVINSPTLSVVAADFDSDGDNDLFVGGHIKPGHYPYSSRSFLLRNDKGTFTDVTKSFNAVLANPGLVTAALWADINRDKKPDLIVAGEWMQVRVFINEGNKFNEQTDKYGLAETHGWWNCLEAADLNEDGWVDIIAGNTGKNSFFDPSGKNPVKITAKDFDKNESIDPIITYHNPVEAERFIVHNRLVLIDQIPSIKRRFETFSQFATTPFDKSFTKEELVDSYEANATVLASTLLINKKGISFEVRDLPEIAQISTINDLLVDDFNNDGHLDLIGIGNNYAQETLFGRYDASLGVVLLGDGKLNWDVYDNVKANFIVSGDARNIAKVNSAEGNLLVIINNDSDAQFFLYK